MNRAIKNTLFGIVGGIAGTAVLGQVMVAISNVQSKRDKRREQRLVPEPPTEKLARGLSRKVLGIELSKDKKATMGEVVHWGYGAFWGGVYGLLRTRVPSI